MERDLEMVSSCFPWKSALFDRPNENGSEITRGEIAMEIATREVEKIIEEIVVRCTAFYKSLEGCEINQI